MGPLELLVPQRRYEKDGRIHTTCARKKLDAHTGINTFLPTHVPTHTHLDVLTFSFPSLPSPPRTHAHTHIRTAWARREREEPSEAVEVCERLPGGAGRALPIGAHDSHGAGRYRTKSNQTTPHQSIDRSIDALCGHRCGLMCQCLSIPASIYICIPIHPPMYSPPFPLTFSFRLFPPLQDTKNPLSAHIDHGYASIEHAKSRKVLLNTLRGCLAEVKKSKRHSKDSKKVRRGWAGGPVEA